MHTPAAILDTIDNAIADYELSADAMRWTPNPSAPATGGRITPAPDVAAFAESCGLVLTEWQRQVANGLYAEQITVCVDAAVEPFRRAAAEAIRGLSLAFAPLVDELRRGKRQRSVRVTQIRRAYRAKRKRW